MPRIHFSRSADFLVPKLLTLILAALALIVYSEAGVKAAKGDLDPTFDGDGKVTTDFFNAYNFGQDVIVQPDGKIIVAGTTQLAGQFPSLSAGGDFALVRYMPDGSIDTNFGNNGRVNTDFFGGDFGLALALQSDGKIVVAGYGDSQSLTDTDFQVARYNADGSLDLSFDTDGKVTTDFSSTDDKAFDVVIQPDGKILVVGNTLNNLGQLDYALARYNPDGSLDSSFGSGGRVITDLSEDDQLFAVALQADGKIIAAGTASQNTGGILDFAVLRYNINGSLDSTFGVGGRVTTDFAGSVDQIFGVVIQPDQKIVVSGISRVAGTSNNNFALARYNPNGSLDTNFDADGKVTTDFFGRTDSANGLALLPSGKIVAGGRATLNTESLFALAQYNANGSLDSGFGTGGKVTTDIVPGANDLGRKVAIQPDGKILLAGHTENTGSQIVDFAVARYIGDVPTGITISDVTVTEGNSGTKLVKFIVNLSAPSTQVVTVNYATSDGTATSADDYTSTSGTLSFNPGQTAKSITVLVIGDTINEEDETFFVNLSGPTNAIITDAQGKATIINDDAPTLQLGRSSYSASEGAGSITIIVNRSGDSSLPVSVSYATSDTADPLQNCDVINGAATSRCDYAGLFGTLHFASGELSKKLFIPVVDDTYLEGTESFFLSLSNPTGGAVIGTNQTATIQITDNGNDGPGHPNPIDNTTFFVRQHYIDFLGREPDPLAAGWVNQINNCVPSRPECDRLSVSQGIYLSPEFRERGYFIYKFFALALGRKPSYAEFVRDHARVSGFQSDAELEQSKVDFIADFMDRTEFHTIYDSKTTARSFVETILATGGLVLPTATRESIISRLGSGAITRAQALREIAESAEANARYINEATIVMHYFGYLRRDPDAFYQDWINILTTTGDSRNVTNGFVNSQEYRARFGQ